MQEFNLKCDKDARAIIIGKMQRMFSSSNLNVLLGSAFSMPYLKTLKDIEKRLSVAMESGDKKQEFEVKQEFFEQSIAPVLGIDFEAADFDDKRTFVRVLTDILALRETSIVHKIMNVFTTNYDNLIEKTLEMNHIDYFDGFEGRIKPRFSTANYGKLVCKQTELSGRLSEIVSVNLLKIHGSLYWKEENGEIYFEDFRNKLIDILQETEQDEFLKKYKQLAIINPEKNKFNSTVMNSNYYDQIRMLANELARQNTLLMTFGFSFADEHILQIIGRALVSNPTLILLVFPYCEDDLNNFREIFRFNNNVYCYYQREDETKQIDNFSLDKMNRLLTEIYNGVK